MAFTKAHRKTPRLLNSLDLKRFLLGESAGLRQFGGVGSGVVVHVEVVALHLFQCVVEGGAVGGKGTVGEGLEVEQTGVAPPDGILGLTLETAKLVFVVDR